MRRTRVKGGVFLSAMLVEVVAGGWLAAQTAAVKPKDAADYRQEPVVIESAVDRVAYENDGTGTRSSRARVRVLSDAGVRQFGLIQFGYAAANEAAEVEYVRVHKPDGTVVETPAENVQDLPADVTLAAPFYSDLRVKHVAVKGLAPGDVVEYSLRARIHTAPVPGYFWLDIGFNRENIVLDQTIELSVPKDRALTMSRAEPKPMIREEGDRRIYTWKSAHPTREEKKEARKAEKAAAPIRVSSFRSWEELGRWYGGLQRGRVAVTPALQARAAELTRNAKSDEEKRKAIYKYVTSQFRYIGIAFGVGRYQPHAADEVLANQYGDCKDKHTLLAAVLKAAGLRAYPALASSVQEVDPEVPSPSQFDHVISAIPQASGFEWLDSTIEVAPYGYLLTPTRDKQVLVIPDDGEARLVKTPAELPFPRREVFRSEGKLDAKGTLEANMDYTLRGDVELVLRLALRNTPQHQWQDIVQRISQISGFAGTVSAVEVSPLVATEEPLRIRYHYTRKEYSDWENQRILPPLPRIGMPIPDEKEPEEEVNLGTPGEVIYESRMTLPEDYSVRPGAPVELREPFAEYTSSDAFHDAVLESKRRLVVKTAKVAVGELKAYREFQKRVSGSEFTFLTLRTREEESKAVSSEASDEAARLVEEARAALQRRDDYEARDLLEKALAADPATPDAWTLLGIARLSTGDTIRGLEALRQEVKLRPRNSRALKALGLALMEAGRTNEAVAVWRNLMEANPNDRDAAVNLGNILVSQKRFEEATSELEKAVASNPRNAKLLSMLGRAYLAAGNRSKGAEALKKAADVEPGPETWNDMAYELADSNQELDLALDYAQKAVQSAEAETARIQLDRLQEADLRQMIILGAYWDTLGWAHYRKGNLEQATQYLEGAWDLSQVPAIADHLGQVYEQQGKRQQAAAAYAWALAAPEGGSLETRRRLEKMVRSQAAVEAAIKRAREDLSRQRTLKLKRVTAGTGSGEFWVLFSRGPKVEDVRFISGDERLREAAQTLKTAPLRVRIPGEGPVKLVRRGILGCFSAVSGCDFVLFNTDTVRRVN